MENEEKSTIDTYFRLCLRVWLEMVSKQGDVAVDDVSVKPGARCVLDNRSSSIYVYDKY